MRRFEKSEQTAENEAKVMKPVSTRTLCEANVSGRWIASLVHPISEKSQAKNEENP